MRVIADGSLSVWDFSARYDQLAAAAHRAAFGRKDRRICELAAAGLGWSAIAARVGCSKSRVQRVVVAARAWRDPDRDAKWSSES